MFYSCYYHLFRKEKKKNRSFYQQRARQLDSLCEACSWAFYLVGKSYIIGAPCPFFSFLFCVCTWVYECFPWSFLLNSGNSRGNFWMLCHKRNLVSVEHDLYKEGLLHLPPFFLCTCFFSSSSFLFSCCWWRIISSFMYSCGLGRILDLFQTGKKFLQEKIP